MALRSSADLFDDLMVGLLPSQPRVPRDTLGKGRRIRSGRGRLTDAPNGARDVLDILVIANAVQLGAFDPELERKIADDVAATREDEPDKPAPLPALDLLAYYWPPQGLSAGHFVMDELQWGIFLPTGGVEYIARFLVEHEGFALENALRVSAEMLYLHEYFHHLVSACAALMQQRVGDPALYENYRARVDGQRGYFELEEALANAFALRIIPAAERDALTRFSRRQPRGYDLAERYLGEAEFRDACESLLAQLKGVPAGDLDLADSQLLGVLTDADGTALGASSAQLHSVESPGSAHSSGEWQLRV